MKAIVLATVICFSLVASASEKGGRKKKPTPPPPTVSNSSSAQNLDTCFSPNGNCDQKLTAFVDGARQTLDIAIYSITLAGLEKSIEEAKSRGVRVRVVVDRSQANGVHSMVKTLRAAGVDLKIGTEKGIMHDKYTIVDSGMVETGSYNYSDNATSDNAENQIYMTDPNVIAKYSADFEILWANGKAN